MKLTSRKKLLEEADKILAEIHTNINTKRVNELDWEEHEKWLAGKSKLAPSSDKERVQSLSDLVKKYKVNQIVKKYKDVPPNVDDEQMGKEIEQMLSDLSIIRSHLTSKERIPDDPLKQTELQKILINFKNTVMDLDDITNKTAEEIYDESNKYSYTDPKTGLKWSKIWGGPMMPDDWLEIGKDPEWGWKARVKNAIKQSNELSKTVKFKPTEYEWDSSRGLLWNIFNKLGSYHLSN